MPRFDAVIFDMDGTLIEPLLDFAALREELGVDPARGILEALDARPPADRAADYGRLLERERDAAGRAALHDGAAEAVAATRAAGLKTALLTRNSRQAMHIVLERFGALAFDLTWAREDGPIKPAPGGVLRACEALGARPQRTACVGDFHYDITAANDAGAVSVLLVLRPPRPHWADEADHVITSLRDLPALLGLDALT